MSDRMRIVPDGTGYFDVEGWPDGPYRHEPMYVVLAPEDVADSTFEAVQAIYRRVAGEVSTNPWRERLVDVEQRLARSLQGERGRDWTAGVGQALREIRAMLEEVDR